MKKTTALVLSFVIALGMQAQNPANTADSTLTNTANVEGVSAEYQRDPVMRKKDLQGTNPDEKKMVKVGSDTVPLIIPQKNYGRFDRGLYNYLFIPKSKWGFGITASYGELNTEDVQVLSMLKNVDFNGKIYSIKPYISYFIGHNQSLGMRLNYSRGDANLQNLSLDIDDDMNFTLRDVSYNSQNFDLGLFYRYYVGLNRGKRFAVFNEVALDFVSGTSKFKRYYNEELFDTNTRTTGVNLNFSPGVCVFIMDYVSFNVSFGVFGLKLHKEKQHTNGVDEGSRFTSGANFKFNIFNINFGLMVVI